MTKENKAIEVNEIHQLSCENVKEHTDDVLDILNAIISARARMGKFDAHLSLMHQFPSDILYNAISRLNASGYSAKVETNDWITISWKEVK